MDAGALTDPGPTTVALGQRRAEVLDLLRGASAPLTVQDVAARTGLHVNTARFHLDGLVDEGLAQRSAEERVTPGRPRILYAPRPQVVDARSYRLLAEMLTGLVAAVPDAGTVARDAGRAWGRHLVERPAPSERIDVDEAVGRLNRVLDDIGFEPAARRQGAGAGGEIEVLLRHCPFREVAERHPDVVCELHRGLLQGALEELRAPLAATSLEPFVTPQLCLARLTGSFDPVREDRVP